MGVEIKFCGLTRPEDAAHAAALGAAYVGVIFAGGPRRLDAGRAAEVLAGAGAGGGGGLRRVGVFGDQTATEIARIADRARLDVVQLHGDPAPEMVEHVRGVTGALVWAVIRVRGTSLPDTLGALDGAADAILFDAYVSDRLGGSGVAFDWAVLTPEARPRRARLIAAGGLTPENVAEAIRALAPHVVDVSSGVEAAPGIKDHARMRAFADAVRRHSER